MAKDYKNRIGEIYFTNNGCEAKIIEYFGSGSCTIQFNDGNVLKNIKYHTLKIGQVKNPFLLSVHGVGFKGVGDKGVAIVAGLKIGQKITVVCNLKGNIYNERRFINIEGWKIE